MHAPAPLRAPLLASFRHGFSLRSAGGPSDHAFDAPGRAAALAAFEAATGLGTVRQTKQVHGAIVVEGARSTEQTEADGLLSFSGGPAVGVRTADCVPILLADPNSGAVAAVHAGWRGVVAGIAPAAVARLRSAPGGLLAAVGPAIGPCCFEVGSEVVDALVNAGAMPEDRRFTIGRSHAGKPLVDLRACVAFQLEKSGLSRDAITLVGGCTFCDSQYHSFRREGAASGRMLAAIAPIP
jgi:YfiH family protein